MTDRNDIAPVILFVDDEADTAKYFQRAIGSLTTVATAASVEEGRIALDKYAGSLLVLVSDQRMPGECGNELLRYASTRHPHVMRILTTAYSELDHTVDAINQGHVHRYIRKPWDIASLRMELKHAVEFAEVRSERDRLLREKMSVRQAQIVAHRIGMLHTICANLTGPVRSPAVDAYLSAARKAWVQAPEPDWLRMDYSDVVSAEASRSAEFSHRVRASLSALEQRYKYCVVGTAVGVLADLLQDKVWPCAQDAVLFMDERVLAEFLEAQCHEAVSACHASWLAFLIWLGRMSGTVQFSRSGSGLQCRLVKRDAAAAPIELAAWIEQF